MNYWASMNLIEGNVYLGNIDAAENVQELQNKKIKRVLTVASYIKPNYDPSLKIEQIQFDVNDMPSQNIYKYFKDALYFMDKSQDNILVHCAAGYSRSATIVVAYFMWKKQWPFDKTLKWAQTKRLIGPNSGFQEQLKIFEKELIKNSYDLEKIDFTADIKWDASW